MVEVTMMDLVELYSRSSADVKFILDATEKFDYPPIIIGGYVRHLHDNLGYNDVDWLCFNDQSLLECRKFMDINFIHIAESLCGNYSFYVNREEFAHNTRNCVHQIHKVTGVHNERDFLSWSDFTICTVGFNKTKALAHRLFDHDLRLKQLRINETYKSSVVKARILKYVQRGFTFVEPNKLEY